MRIMDCGILAACICAGAVASASTANAETDWGTLDSAAWGSVAGSSSATGDEAVQFVEANSAAGADFGTAIRAAFVELGMAEPRAACFGKVLAENLSPESQREAAELVSQSASADDVKVNVIAGGPEMVGGFSAADASCPEGIGG